MPRIAWILPTLGALIIAALPGITGSGVLREAPVILAFLLLGWAAQRSALFTALGLGLALDILGHLPLGTMLIPGLALSLGITLLAPGLRRGQLAMQCTVILVAAFAYSALAAQWITFLGLPVAGIHWAPPLLASLLWLPFAMLTAPADSALESHAAF